MNLRASSFDGARMDELSSTAVVEIAGSAIGFEIAAALDTQPRLGWVLDVRYAILVR